jgi:hypothetical protein
MAKKSYLNFVKEGKVHFTVDLKILKSWKMTKVIGSLRVEQYFDLKIDWGLDKRAC